MGKTKNSAILGVLNAEAGNPSKKQTNGFCNGVLTFCNAVAFERSDGRRGKYLIAPFGDWKNGDVVQRVDATAAEILKRNLGSIWARVKNALGNACPVYYEHPDHEDAEDNPPNADKTPYGRVRSLETLAHGIYANIEWLDGFEALPKRLQISPRWNAVEIAENIVRPSRLISIGLTSHPNIKATSYVNHAVAWTPLKGQAPYGDCKNNAPIPNSELKQKEINMDKEILKLLGYSDDEAQKIIDKAADAPTDVLERLRTALAEKAALSNDLEAAKKDCEEKDKQLEAAKTELANSRDALKKSQTARAELVVANAIRSGKIIEAQRKSAVKILANSDDFETDEAELAKAPDAVKTKSETDGIEKSEKERLFGQQKAQAEFAKLVSEKQAQGMEYGEAWNAAKTEKPEIFKAAYPNE